MAGKPKYKPEDIAAALTATKGMVTLAAKKLGCSVNTIYAFIKKHPTVAEAAMEARELTTDTVELKLFDRIMAGDTTAIIFYLKTQGKKRGYVERVENVNFNVDPELVQRLIDAIEGAGYSVHDIFEQIIQEVAAEANGSPSR